MSKKSERVRNISKLGKNLLTWEIFQAKLQDTVIKRETNPRLSFEANVCKIRHTYREPFPVRRWVCSFPKAAVCLGLLGLELQPPSHSPKTDTT